MTIKSEAEELFDEYAWAKRIKKDSENVYRRGVMSLSEYTERKGASLLTACREDVEAWIEGKTYELAPATCYSYLSVVRCFYSWLEEEGVRTSPVKGVSLPHLERGARDSLKPAQAREVLDALRQRAIGGGEADKRDYSIVCLALRCFVRPKEMIDADIGDLHFSDREAVLVTKPWGNTEKTSVVLFDAATKASIEDYLDSRRSCQPEDPLLSSVARRNRGGKLTLRTISRVLSEALSVVGGSAKDYSFGKTALELAASEGASELECREFARMRSWNLAIETSVEGDRRSGSMHKKIEVCLSGRTPRPYAATIPASSIRSMVKPFSDETLLLVHVDDEGGLSIESAP